MAIKFSGVSEPLQIFGRPQTQTFSLQEFPTKFQLVSLGAWIHTAKAEFSNMLDSQKRICFSSIFSNMQSLAQSFDRSSHINFDNTSMANPVLVPSDPLIFAKVPDLLQGPKEELQPRITKGNLQLLPWIFSGKGYFRRNIKGICHSYRKCQTIRHNPSLQIVLA